MRHVLTVALFVSSAAAPAALGGAQVFTSAGSDAEVTAALNAFRSALGPLNPNNPGSVGSGRREINWDDVPDSASAPNLFPPDFFNANATGRARGVVLTTPGSGFMVSADSDNPTQTPTRFANLNPQYGDLFRAFSPQRLFTPPGHIAVVDFFVPGTDIPATVSGFGVVFSDVDLPDTTELFFISPEGEVLTTAFAPVSSVPNGGASFVGVHFTAGERVARVGIASGNTPLDGLHTEGPGPGGFFDLVVIDDLIYGEPVPIIPATDDQDHDGVPDHRDLCADTIAGVEVDVSGCPPIIPGDFDRDGDVDQTDFAVFQRCQSGPNVPADPTCAD